MIEASLAVMRPFCGLVRSEDNGDGVVKRTMCNLLRSSQELHS